MTFGVKSSACAVASFGLAWVWVGCANSASYLLDELGGLPLEFISAGDRKFAGTDSVPQYTMGDEVSVRIWAYSMADTVVPLTHYRVRVVAPLRTGEMRPEVLTNRTIELDGAALVAPGDPMLLDWRFEITRAMAARLGEYELIFTFPELGNSARGSFVVVERSERARRRS